MKKSEAEPAIRSLCHTWARETAAMDAPDAHPSFSDFTSWLRANGYGGYLDFRSTMGAKYDAEMWFDQELKQTWRN